MSRRAVLGLAPLLGLLTLAACAPEPQTIIIRESAGRVGCDTSFRVVNNSSLTVEQLYFSHASLGGWGNDQLGQNVLPVGRAMSYRAANTGLYDFRIVWSNGRSSELRGVNVCVAATITVTNSGLRAS